MLNVGLELRTPRSQAALPAAAPLPLGAPGNVLAAVPAHGGSLLTFPVSVSALEDTAAFLGENTRFPGRWWVARTLPSLPNGPFSRLALPPH